MIKEYYGNIINLVAIGILLTLSLHATITYSKVGAELFNACTIVCDSVKANVSSVNFWGEDSLCVCENKMIPYYVNGTKYQLPTNWTLIK